MEVFIIAGVVCVISFAIFIRNNPRVSYPSFGQFLKYSLINLAIIISLVILWEIIRK